LTLDSSLFNNETSALCLDNDKTSTFNYDVIQLLEPRTVQHQSWYEWRHTVFLEETVACIMTKQQSSLWAICRPSGCTVVSGVVVVVVVVSVCNRSQMRASRFTCLIFWCEYRPWPWLEMHKRNFYRSKFKVTCDLSPTISGWLLVCLCCCSMLFVLDILCVFLWLF